MHIPFFNTGYQWLFCPSCKIWYALTDEELLDVYFRPKCEKGHHLAERARNTTWEQLSCIWGIMHSITPTKEEQRPKVSDSDVILMHRSLLLFFRERMKGEQKSSKRKTF